jgi:hypothetical protein
MTTPSNTERPELPAVDEFMDAPYTAHRIAKDLVAKLEAELRYTKRALEMRCAASFDPLSKPVEYWLEMARKEGSWQ